ncbi:MAG: hypothetical protein KGL29_08535 [Alphaproteobacteria bacterium]|nr:hypothetical protein [Alphaproteobacteria bacterium]MDE2162073.1 hypothetical protein [Alphaproteobacteria bacterium]MDE2265931.1 hypothetical protein [Alphaproteobacteria bacterium]MDE2500634.1 hypothetical protein [Alphaproteobacteria bacterium]
MPRVSAAFFLFGALCVLVGMFWGMHMGESNDFQMMPAHAHLNLVGWVTMSLYGTFYALTAQTMSNRLAWTNFALSALGVLTMVPSLAALLATNNSAVLPSLIAGEALTVLGLLTFLISVWREFFRKRA